MRLDKYMTNAWNSKGPQTNKCITDGGFERKTIIEVFTRNTKQTKKTNKQNTLNNKQNTLQAEMHEYRGSRTMLPLRGPFLNWT